MTLRIFIPRDAGAVAVGAEEVALAFGQAAGKRGTGIGNHQDRFARPVLAGTNGRSRKRRKARVAFGPMSETDVDSVLDAMLADGQHKLRLGLTEEIPWLKRQTRLTFAALRRDRSALS